MRLPNVATTLAKLVGGNSIKQIGATVFSFVCAHTIGPFEFGVWQALKLIITYGVNCTGGTAYALERMVPLLLSQGKVDEARSVAAAVRRQVVLIAAILWTALMVLAALPLFRREVRLVLAGLAFILAATLVADVYRVICKGERRFGVLSGGTTAFGIVIGTSALLVYRWGLVGLLVGQFSAILASLIVYRRGLRGDAVVQAAAPASLKPVLAIGVPIMLSSFVTIYQLTVDRLVVASMLGAAAVGYYSLGGLLYVPFERVVGAINDMFYPRLVAMHGRGLEPPRIFRHMMIVLRSSAVLLALAVGTMALIAPLITRWLLPKYGAGVPAAQVLLLALAVSSLSGLVTSAFFSLARFRFLLAMQVAGGLTNLVAAVALARRYGIVGVAASTLLANAVYFTALLVQAGRLHHVRMSEVTGAAVRCLVPTVLVLVIVLAEARLIVPRLVDYGPAPAIVFLLLAVPLGAFEGRRLWREHSGLAIA